MSARRSRRAVGATTAVAALAVVGGVAAQFTTSTTSAPQQIGTGTLALAIDSVAPIVWTDDISNLAAGDSVERFLDLRNAGSLKMAAISLSQTNTLGDLLTAPSDVSVKLQRCTVAWNATTGACSGQTSVVLDSSSVRQWGDATKSLNTFTDFGAGDIAKLKLTTTLNAGATNAVQNKKGTITYTFGGTQRTGGTAGTASEASTPVVAPSNFITTASAPGAVTASWTDTNNGAASYVFSWGETGNAAAAPSTVSLPAGSTSYTVSGLTPGKSYSFGLSTEKSGQSVSLANSSVAPSAAVAPSGLTFASSAANSATISFTDTNAGAATYSIVATPTSGLPVSVNVPSGQTSYTFPALTGGTAYTFVVKATKLGTTAQSQVSGTPQAATTTFATAGTQNFTVPSTGYYNIEASGASGGDATSLPLWAGAGARVSGKAYLTQGTVLKLMIGSKGGDNVSSGGGGGGSFVVLSTAGPNSAAGVLAVAGGGGGEGKFSHGDLNGNANEGDFNVIGRGSPDANPTNASAGGGGGYRNSGANPQNTTRGSDGKAFTAGGSGGYPAYGYSGMGGFGGGGAGGGDGGTRPGVCGTYGCTGGSGGGFQGGSTPGFQYSGSGGYSHLDGSLTNISRSSGVNSGDGKIVISYLGS